MPQDKPITPWTMAMTIAGFYLGAGYLSGQELWQFFGVYGKMGLLGAALAVSTISALGVALFSTARLSGLKEFSAVAIRFKRPWLHRAFCFLQILFTFSVYIIMSAGGGALMEQVFGLPAWLGGGLFCLAVALASLKGVTGMLSAFRFTVPVLTAITLLIALAAAIQNGGEPVSFAEHAASSPLLGGWGLSATVYLSYNFFGAIFVFAPLFHIVPMRSVKLGSAIGGGVLLAIALTILLCIAMFPEAASAQLPMLAIATGLNPYLGYICAAPLLCGMFGTSLSSLVAVLEYGELRFDGLKGKRPHAVAALALLAWACGLVGFGELIGIIYPLCGYAGFAAIALMLEHLIWLKRHGNAQAEQ